MTMAEYERMQSALVAKMNENLYVKYGKSGGWADGFREGLLVARSILHDEYRKKEGKRK